MGNKENTSFRPLGAAEIIERLTKKEGKTPSALIRKALFFYDNQGRLTYVKLSDILKNLLEIKDNLSRVGGNLNQIARAFNSDGTLKDDELAATHAKLRKFFDSISRLHTQITNDIGEKTGGKKRTRVRKTRKK